MKRSKPLRRVARLVSRTPMPRTSSLKGGAHRRRATAPPPAVVAAVIARDGGCCLLCGCPAVHGERGRDWSIGHRIPRGMGGTRRAVINSVSNLYVVCGSGTDGCHGESESRRAESYQNGWLLRHGDNPAAEPILAHHGSRWLYLAADGTYHDQPPAVAS